MRLIYHVYWSILDLFLWYIIPASHLDHLGCKLKGLELIGAENLGDVLIGAVLPIHFDMELPKVSFMESPPQGSCKMFSAEMFQHFHVMRYTVDEINRRNDLLPNLTLGFHIFDSCTWLQLELDSTFRLLTGYNKGIPNYSCRERPPLPVIIGHSLSTFSILMAYILGLYKYPQISHFSTSFLLSDRTQFPSFFRTVPSDVFQSQGLAKLVLHFGWTWIGLVASNNDYGQQGIQVIKNEILNAGACVAFTEYIMTNRLDRNVPHIAKAIKHSTAKAIVVFTTESDLVFLLDEMLKQNVKGKIFVASEAWSTLSMLLVDKYTPLLSGAIGFSFYSSKIPNFEGYFNNINLFDTLGQSWMKIFWENVFGCKLFDNSPWENFTKLCTGNEDLNSLQSSFNDVSNLRSAYSLYTAIHVIAKALHDLQTCQDESGPFYNRSCADSEYFKPWQLLYYIQNVKLKLSNDREVFFDKNGDPPAIYDIVNWQLGADGMLQHVKVGSYDTTLADRKLVINNSAVMWDSRYGQAPTSVCNENCPSGFRRVVIRGAPICCFRCVPCPPEEISNQTGSVDCIKCPKDKWPNQEKDKCLPKIIEFLSFEDTLGATLVAISITSSMVPVCIFGLFIFYKATPIVRANNYYLSCILLVSLTLCFLCSLAFIGYPKPLTCLLQQAAFGVAFALCISCILAKTIMVVFAFMATKPGSRLRKWASPYFSYMIIALCSFLQLLLCICWLFFSPPFVEYNTQTEPGLIIMECNENSTTAFWCMLGYLGFLASFSFIVAFLARHLPDSFNEAKFITFSMLAFLCVWTSFIPASLSARGKYIVAMEVFAILSSSWALVGCMFVPKCFIILFKPSMNSKEHLMGKISAFLSGTYCGYHKAVCNFHFHAYDLEE
ncbi:extracellular calcium-sensing receptor-like [Bombina bombina]|uniref:extracellular calcium-sensing receptor-like n=1 Tax=Bombina bombina TaxID=8345 RepID=UPI00235A4E87|nr:extracellular calcium-sensing receptor-like [Bombina bombina]